MASICCSPPDSVRPPDGALGQDGKALRDALQVGGDAGAVAAQIAAHLQVLGHRHVGKHAPPLGALGDAELEDAPRGGARDVLAEEPDAARRPGAARPRSPSSVVVLPAPLAPTGHQLALARRDPTAPVPPRPCRNGTPALQPRARPRLSSGRMLVMRNDRIGCGAKRARGIEPAAGPGSPAGKRPSVPIPSRRECQGAPIDYLRWRNGWPTLAGRWRRWTGHHHRPILSCCLTPRVARL